MRIRLTLHSDLKRSQIPINYNGDVSRFVRKILQPVTKPVDAAGGKQSVRNYTFSNLYIPDVQQSGRSLVFGQVPVEFTISLEASVDVERAVVERLYEVEGLEFTDPTCPILRVTAVHLLSEPKFRSRRARFRMASPLASPMLDAREAAEGSFGDSRAPVIHYSNPSFGEAIRLGMLARFAKAAGHAPADTEFRLTLDPRYVQRRRGRISKLVTIDESTPSEQRIRAIVAPFECEGNPELIAFGYVAGFGEATSLGFGCVEYASDPSEVIRTISLNPKRVTSVSSGHFPSMGNRSIPEVSSPYFGTGS